MDDYLRKQTLEKLTKATNILIAASKNSAFDGLASALAIYLSCIKLGKNITIVAKPPTVDDAKKLYGVGKIGKDENEKNLVISIDNAIKNVDKVTYYLEGDKLKIIVHALPDSAGVSRDEIKFENFMSQYDLIFAIGYESSEQLKNEITHEQDFTPECWIISVNNNELSEKFAQVNVHEHGAASISEIAAILIQDLALPMDEDIAFNLYSGIAEATKMFSPAYAKISSFEAALRLIKFGAGKASLAAKSPTEVQLSNGIPQSKQNQQLKPTVMDKSETPPEEIETKRQTQESWLKPPKIYRGSKSFDSES